jgi:hypothetical protein
MKALRVPFAAGAFAGCLFVVVLLFLNIGGLGTLTARDAARTLPLLMLLIGFAALFGIAVASSSLAFVERPNGHRRRWTPITVRASSAVRKPRPRSR